MKLLESSKLELPTVFFVSDRSRVEEVPIGVPFIYGDESMELHIIRILEYEVLYQAAVKTGFPFNFAKILEENGFKDLIEWGYDHPIYVDYKTEGMIDLTTFDINDTKTFGNCSHSVSDFIRDSSVYVNIEKLKMLNVFPVWLDTLEKAVHTNIHNFSVYNSDMYNKKLGGMYGSLELVSPSKNLLVVDISGSIPKGVSSTVLTLAKHLATSFYADLVITGSKSTLYPYEELYKLNINTIYDENGMDNDQIYFKNLVTSEKKIYKTAIVFGDNHSPSYPWCNAYNKGSRAISEADGKKICKWEVQKLISFHTDGVSHIAGYSTWFSPQETEKIADWVKYLV